MEEGVVLPGGAALCWTAPSCHVLAPSVETQTYKEKMCAALRRHCPPKGNQYLVINQDTYSPIKY